MSSSLPRPGRPKLPLEARRVHEFRFYLSDFENELFRSRVLAAGCSAADFARGLVLFSEVSPPPPIPRINLAFVGQLGRLGSSINQLTRIVHTGRFPADDLARHLVNVDALLVEVRDLLRRPVSSNTASGS